LSAADSVRPSFAGRFRAKRETGLRKPGNSKQQISQLYQMGLPTIGIGLKMKITAKDLMWIYIDKELQFLKTQKAGN